jgi:O-antigen/teichoic acid export membrane protein
MSKLLKNVASLGVVQLVNYVFPLITVPYISRIIGPEGYGIINYATAFVAYFVLLVGYGFDLTATRRIALDPNDLLGRNKVFSEVINARVILLMLSFLLFLLAILFLEPIKKDIRVSLLLFITCLSTILTPQFIYQGLQELSIFAKVNFVKGLISTILVFMIIKNPDDYIWLITINVSVGLLMSIFFLLHAFKKFKLKFNLIAPRDTFILLWNERMIFLSTIVVSLYTTTNTVLLGFFDSIDNVGYFTTSQSFLTIITTVLTVPLATALFPYIGTSFSISREQGLDIVSKILPIVFYIVTFSCLGLWLFSPFLVSFLYGGKFNNSILPLQIMSLLPLIICLSNMFGIQVMLNLGLDRLFFKITAICSILGLTCNVFMSKYWGYIGTAWNIVIIESIVTTVMYISLKRIGVDIFQIQNFYPKNIIIFLKNNLSKNK